MHNSLKAIFLLNQIFMEIHKFKFLFLSQLELLKILLVSGHATPRGIFLVFLSPKPFFYHRITDWLCWKRC